MTVKIIHIDMQCIICGQGPRNGISVYRQNPKGGMGIWKCFIHSKPQEPDLVEIVKILEGKEGVDDSTVN